MARFLRIKTNLPRELDVNLYPIMDEVHREGRGIDEARMEVFFLKYCAGRAAVAHSKKRKTKRKNIVAHYDRAMEAAFRVSFPDQKDEYQAFFEQICMRYEYSSDGSLLAADLETIGRNFSMALIGVSASRHVSELGAALYNMKYQTIRNYVNSKWVIN